MSTQHTPTPWREYARTWRDTAMNVTRQRDALLAALREAAMRPCPIPFDLERSEFEAPARTEKREAFRRGFELALQLIGEHARAAIAKAEGA